jgi:hypothetical protein
MLRRSLSLFRYDSKCTFPKEVMEKKDICANFLKINKFKPHPVQTHFMYGIYRDDVDITISYTEQDNTQTLWRFVSSHSIPKTGYFVNPYGQIRIIDFNEQSIANQYTRMEII